MKNAVEEYIEKQRSPKKEILRELRRIILETLPNASENMRWGVPCLDKKFYLLALKDHVNMGFSVNGLTDREKNLFDGKGKLMNHVKIRYLDGIDEERIVKLLKLVAEKGGRCEEEHTR